MSQEERTAELIHDLPHSIQLNRGMTGNYGWEIKLRSEDGEEMTMVNALAALDEELRKRFLPQPKDYTDDLQASVEQAKASKTRAQKNIEEAERAAEARRTTAPTSSNGS